MKQQKASILLRFVAMWLDSLFISVVLVPSLFFMGIFGIAVIPFVSFLYYGIMEGCFGATLGKMICSLVVLDQNGRRIDAGRGFLRALCRALSGLIFGIGYLIALFDDNGAALHDKLAGTFVADSRAIGAGAGYSVGGGGIPKVIGLNGYFAGTSFIVPDKGLIIGREQLICTIAFPLNTPGISKTHCKVEYNPQTRMFILQDLGSSHGTFMRNGVRVTNQPVALDPGSEFYLASAQVSFRVEA